MAKYDANGDCNFIAGVLLQGIPSSDAGKSNVDYNTGIFMYLKYGLE